MGAPTFAKPIAVTHNALLWGVEGEDSAVCGGCIVRLTCGHAFHTNCLKEWVTHSAPVADFATPRQPLPVNTCPLCHKQYPADDVARTLGIRVPAKTPVDQGYRRLWPEWNAENEEMRRRDREERIAEFVARDMRYAEDRIADAAKGPSRIGSTILGGWAALNARNAMYDAFGRDDAAPPSVFGPAAAAAVLGIGAVGMHMYEDWHDVGAEAREREEMREWLRDAPARAAKLLREEEADDLAVVFPPHAQR